MPDTPEPYEPPKVENRVPQPPGILPRNTQTWMVAGIALVMVVIIAFSGRSPAPDGSAPTAPREAAVADPVQARIQEYRARIDEQARKLALEQAQVTQARQALGAAASGAPLAGTTSLYGAAPGQGARGLYEDPMSSALARERAEIAAAKLKRQYDAAFASNIVLSRREMPLARTDASPAPAPAPAPAQERSEQTHLILEGTAIETVLTNRLDGSFSGPVNCMVTTDVYSHDRDKLLVPSGSRVLGEVRAVDSFGQQRLAVSFHRLILPNGYSVALEKMPGLNQLGETGLVDQVNRHYLQIFGVSLAIGAIAGLNQSTTRYGPDASASDVYRQGVTGSVAQTSLSILDRYLNVLPTFTIREGHRVKVYLTGDLALPAYDPEYRPRNL